MQPIPYGRQSINQHDIDEVVSVLQSDFLTQGPAVPKFEEGLGHLCNAKYALAVNSATSALHLACLALGVQGGDTVWTSAITFVASANCARYCGATIDFIDIDPKTYNLSITALENKLKVASQTGALPKVLIAVHLAGQPCEMRSLKLLSEKYGFRIIEDASHAIGSSFEHEPVGNSKYSDITIFSFHPVKIITTGEGGAAMTNDRALFNRMQLLRSHGITRDSKNLLNPTHGSWYYEQLELGFNYRITDIQAALGLSQLMRLSEFIDKRRKLAARYDQLLADLPVRIPWQDPKGKSAFHLYIIRLDRTQTEISHRQIFENLRNCGILVNLHYIPVYRQPYYANMGFDPQNFPESEAYYREAISLPLYPDLSDEQQAFVAEKLRENLPVR